jgi:hypothetical protein
VSRARFEDEVERILASGDRAKIVRALARLIHDEEKRDERLGTLRRLVSERAKR